MVLSPMEQANTARWAGSSAGRPEDGLVLVDVGDDVGDGGLVVAQVAQGPGHGLVDDGHGAPADQLLGLDQAQVGLDAGGVAVHHQADGAGGGQHRGLRVADPELLGQLAGLVPGLLGRAQQLGRDQLLVDVGRRGAVHVEDPEHVLGVLGVAGEGAHAGRGAGRDLVGVAGHERGDGGGPGPALGRVVGGAGGHEQGAQVGVAQAQLAELPAVVADGLGRVVGPAHQDLLAGEHDRAGLLEAVDVEGAVVEELEQVDRGQVAGRVVDVHVLAARVGPVDAIGVGRGVPPVDGGVVLHARIGALPGGLGELAHEVAGLDGADDLAGGDGAQVPVGVVDHGLHELVGDPHRVVGVLVLDRGHVLAVEAHVEAGLLEDPDLLLLAGLDPDELLHVGVGDVEDDHLGGPAGLAAALDGAGRGVGAPHEADRARGGAAALEVLDRGADLGQVDARARAALEDDALLPVPVQDGVHGVVDGEDEAGAGLLGDAGDADVEPHRRVERRLLGDQEVLELGPEGLGLGLVDEVAALDAPGGDGVGHPVDDLAQRALPLGRAQGAPEVLLGHDVGGVDGPVGGELDPELLEGDRAVGPVGDAGVAPVPLHGVVGVLVGPGEVAADADAGLLGGEGHGGTPGVRGGRVALDGLVVRGVRRAQVGAVPTAEPPCPHRSNDHNLLCPGGVAAVPDHKMWRG